MRPAGVACGTGPVTPVPFNPTAYVRELPLNPSRPVPEPATVGLNFILNVQLAPAATVVPQVVVCEKGPEIEMPERFSSPFPAFINATVCAAVVPPIDCLPN